MTQPRAQRLFERAIVRVTARETHGEAPENVAEFLQGLVTNDVTSRLPVYAGLLTAQGKAMFDFIVWPQDTHSLLIDCEAAYAGDLVKRLALYRLRRKLDITLDETLGVYWQPEKDGGNMPDPRLADLGHRWIAPVSDHDRGADAAWLAHRLTLGVPEGKAELGDILWLETNAVELNGVSFDKGCYIGQENTARMNWRQKVNRRLVVVPMDRSHEKRRKAAYPEHGLAVDHLALADISAELAPDWMRISAS